MGIDALIFRQSLLAVGMVFVMLARHAAVGKQVHDKYTDKKHLRPAKAN